MFWIYWDTFLSPSFNSLSFNAVWFMTIDSKLRTRGRPFFKKARLPLWVLNRHQTANMKSALLR